MAVLGLIILFIITFSAIFAPWLAPNDPQKTDILNSKEGPSWEHWLGTDRLGRDVFSRILYGGRISITVGLISMSISVVIGSFLGLLAGFFGGWMDTLISRLVDIFGL